MNIKHLVSCVIDESLELVNDFRGIWEKGDIETKKNIQNILFSNQIEYNPKKMSYRTPNENSVMSMLTESRGKIKARKRGQKPTNSRFVHPIALFSKQSLKLLNSFLEIS